MIVDPFSYYNNLYSQSGTLKKKYQEGGSSGYESEDSLKSQVSEMIESGESPKTVAAYLSQIGLSESEIRDMFSEYGYSDSDLDELFNSEEETDDLEESDESEQTKEDESDSDYSEDSSGSDVSFGLFGNDLPEAQYGNGANPLTIDQFMNFVNGQDGYVQNPIADYLPMDLASKSNIAGAAFALANSAAGLFSGKTDPATGLKQGFFRDSKVKRERQKEIAPYYYDYKVNINAGDTNQYAADINDLYSAAKNKGPLRTKDEYIADELQYSRIAPGAKPDTYNFMYRNRPINENLYNDAQRRKLNQFIENSISASEPLISVPEYSLPKAQIGGLGAPLGLNWSPRFVRSSESNSNDEFEDSVEKRIYIEDPRKINATTGKKINPNKDLFSGEYDLTVINDLLKRSKLDGLSREDAYNLLAMGLQETNLGKTDSNIGHVRQGTKEETDYIAGFAKAYRDKMQYADRLKIKDPALRLQVYNGLGMVYPDTEKKYHTFEMKNVYGVPVPKSGINMRKNPLYGKRIIDLRDNVLMKNKELKSIVDQYYSPKMQTGGQPVTFDEWVNSDPNAMERMFRKNDQVGYNNYVNDLTKTLNTPEVDTNQTSFVQNLGPFPEELMVDTAPNAKMLTPIDVKDKAINPSFMPSLPFKPVPKPEQEMLPMPSSKPVGEFKPSPLLPVDSPKVKITNKAEGDFNRFMDSRFMQGYGNLSNFAVNAADFANEIFKDKKRKNAEGRLYDMTMADNYYSYNANPMNKKGTWDVNTGLQEQNNYTNYQMFQEGGMYKGSNTNQYAEILDLDSDSIAELISLGANIEIL